MNTLSVFTLFYFILKAAAQYPVPYYNPLPPPLYHNPQRPEVSLNKLCSWNVLTWENPIINVPNPLGKFLTNSFDNLKF